MDLFKSLPLKKQEYMNRLFMNCTEEVKYYMSVIDVEADQTFIKAQYLQMKQDIDFYVNG